MTKEHILLSRQLTHQAPQVWRTNVIWLTFLELVEMERSVKYLTSMTSRRYTYRSSREAQGSDPGRQWGRQDRGTYADAVDS